MYKYSLDKYESSLFLNEFINKKLILHPARESGLYRFQKGKRTKIAEVSRGYSAAQLEQMRHKGIVEIYLSEDVEHAFCTLGPEDREFDVRIESKGGKVEEGIMEDARTIISQIVELDKEARDRTHKESEDHEEELAYIDIKHNEVELHYYATTVNTEWGTFFRKSKDGRWTFEGIG
jgi:hypothetical protein